MLPLPHSIYKIGSQKVEYQKSYDERHQKPTTGAHGTFLNRPETGTFVPQKEIKG